MSLKKYQVEDEEIIEASSPLEVVEKLKAAARFCADQSIQEYMAGFAFRSKQYDGSEIRSDTPENFVDDLLGTGYLTLVE